MNDRPIHCAIWERSDFSQGAKLLAARIESYQRGRLGWCVASNATLAREIGLKETRSVRRLLAELRELGALDEEATSRTTRRRLREITPDRSDPGRDRPRSGTTPDRSGADPGPFGPEPRSVRTPKDKEDQEDQDPSALERLERKRRILAAAGVR